MRLVESFLTKNPCYTAGRKITVKGLMLHSVGCPQPKAQVFLASWNHASFGSACVHVSLMGMMERCIRHCHGITGDGTVAPVVREVEIIRILVWRYVSLPASGTQADLVLPAPIWQRQGHLQCGRMKQRWNCLPCFVRSLVWIRWQMVW